VQGWGDNCWNRLDRWLYWASCSLSEFGTWKRLSSWLSFGPEMKLEIYFIAFIEWEQLLLKDHLWQSCWFVKKKKKFLYRNYRVCQQGCGCIQPLLATDMSEKLSRWHYRPPLGQGSPHIQFIPRSLSFLFPLYLKLERTTSQVRMCSYSPMCCGARVKDMGFRLWES
jgi:hypothetical protein